MPLRISSLNTLGGHTVQLGHLTVLVGPNNCGKSQTLRDIRDYVLTGSVSKLTILEELAIELPSTEEILKNVSLLPHQSPGHRRIIGVASDLRNRHEFAPHDNWVSEFLESAINPNRTPELLRNMGAFLVAHLDAESRFQLAAPTESFDTRTESPSNALQQFFVQGSDGIKELRGAFKEAFNVDIALDWAAMRRLYLKVGKDFGAIPDSREELDKLLRDANPLADQGDGYKSFAGVAIAMLTFSERVLLLDEPEAFLHPAQARALGRWLAVQAKKRSAQVIVASHSADLLWGIVSANCDATVIRLNRSDVGTTYHVIKPEATSELVQSPLLSSQPVLDALFHRGVIVCEGDPDRAIYQTIAHNVIEGSNGGEFLFIHSNGKDAMKKPIQLLRDAGAPVCAITDIDVLNSPKTLADIVISLTSEEPSATICDLQAKVATTVEQVSQEKLLESLMSLVSEWVSKTHTDLRQARRSLVAIARQGSKWDVVKSRGIDCFEGEVRHSLNELLDNLSKIGLFVVPCGELESWIKLGFAKGQKWNRGALEQVNEGKCPEELAKFIKGAIEFLCRQEGSK